MAQDFLSLCEGWYKTKQSERLWSFEQRKFKKCSMVQQTSCVTPCWGVIVHRTCCKILGDLKQIAYKGFIVEYCRWTPNKHSTKIRQLSHHRKSVKIQDGRRKIMKTTNNGQTINISNIFKEQNLFKMKSVRNLFYPQHYLWWIIRVKGNLHTFVWFWSLP